MGTLEKKALLVLIFLPSICPLRSEICQIPAFTDSRPERADFGSERADFSPARAGRGWIEGRTDGRMNKQTEVPCVLQDFVPLGTAALLSLTPSPIHNYVRRATGITVHIWPWTASYSFVYLVIS